MTRTGQPEAQTELVRWKRTSNESEIVSKKKAKKQKESSDTPDTGLKNKANTSKQTKVS